MLDKIVRHLRKRQLWRRAARELERVRTTEEFSALLARLNVRPPYVSAEPAEVAYKHRVAGCLLDGYGVEVRGRRVLDIGAGGGGFLDVARERGALACGVDHDPFVIAWLRLRGHLALRGNALRSLSFLQGQWFEVINCFGAIVVEYFDLAGRRALRRWLARVERLRAPGGTVLISPYWEVRGVPLVRKAPDPQHCTFTRELERAGYRLLPRLSPVHDEPMYPVTYGKLGGSAAILAAAGAGS
jgi:SAM-dependent methyltransferase